MKKLFAVFLLLLGVGMVVCGVYYDEVLEMLGVSTTTEEKREFSEYITCTKTKRVFEAGFKTDEKSIMYFNTRGLLTSIEDETILSPIDNSVETTEKINRYYTKMDDLLNSFYKFKGFEEKHSNEEKEIKYSMKFNLKTYSNKDSEKEKEENTDVSNDPNITTDEDGNAIIDFTSMDKEGNTKFSYGDKYKEVKKEREKEGFSCK